MFRLVDNKAPEKIFRAEGFNRFGSSQRRILSAEVFNRVGLAGSYAGKG
jgi:hypothetical protein